MPGCPGPLEIVAPQPAGDVEDFSDEIKPGNFVGLEGLGGQLTGVNPAPRDFGFAVALGSAGLELPVMKDAVEGRGVPLGKLPGRAVLLPIQIQETLGQAFGQVLSQQGFECGFRTFGLPLQDGVVQAQVRQQVEGDRLARGPVAGELQNGGTAQPFVGKQNCIPEGGPAGCDRRDDGHAGQAPVALDVRGLVGQRHQRGRAGNDPQAELSGNFITEARGACSRVRQAAGRHDQRGSGIRGRVGLNDEGIFFLYFFDGTTGLDGDTPGLAFGLQQVDDPMRPTVAEKLAGCFFVIGDAVLLDQLDEVERGEPAERGSAEVRVVGQIVFGLDLEMGEVAASAAGNQDLLADVWRAFKQQHLPAALPGRAAAHQARGTGADDHGVKCGFGRHGCDPITKKIGRGPGAGRCD